MPRKALQLSRQVQRALTYILSELDDEILGDVFVDSVQPAPNASRLLVTVSTPETDLEPAEILQHLYESYREIRMEVAASIHRRRVPELIFQFSSP